jgi:hypothetical protein
VADGPTDGSARRTREVRAPAGLGEAVREQFSLQMSVGGARGLVESVLPVTIFTVIYALGREMRPAVLGAVAVAVVLTVARLIARQPVSQAVSGLLGVGAGALLAVLTGQAVNFFAFSILKNIVYGLVYLISVLVRWPLIGVFLGFMLGEGTHWRQVPERRRVYAWATLVWVGMFGLRLAFQIPLYLRDGVTELGVASVPLGLPLFAVVLLITWWIVRRVPVARPPEPDSAEPDPAESDPAERETAEPESAQPPQR